jgi:hypothetical protein
LILVVIEASDVERVSEGLRAAIGLGLRGDPVAAVLTGPAARLVEGDDPRIARALRTLAELGRPAEIVDDAERAARERTARAVEVWTSPGAPRRMRVGQLELAIEPGAPRFRGPGGQAIDAADLVAQILGSDGPVVVR